MGWYVHHHIHGEKSRLLTKNYSGQVIALFIVGLGLYGVVWKGTDWDKEVKQGIERNTEIESNVHQEI